LLIVKVAVAEPKMLPASNRLVKTSPPEVPACDW